MDLRARRESRDEKARVERAGSGRAHRSRAVLGKCWAAAQNSQAARSLTRIRATGDTRKQRRAHGTPPLCAANAAYVQAAADDAFEDFMLGSLVQAGVLR